MAGPLWRSSETVLQPTAKELALSVCEHGSPPSQASLAVTSAQDNCPGTRVVFVRWNCAHNCRVISPSLSRVNFDAVVQSLVWCHICVSQPDILQLFCVCWRFKIWSSCLCTNTITHSVICPHLFFCCSSPSSDLWQTTFMASEFPYQFSQIFCSTSSGMPITYSLVL